MHSLAHTVSQIEWKTISEFEFVLVFVFCNSAFRPTVLIAGKHWHNSQTEKKIERRPSLVLLVSVQPTWLPDLDMDLYFLVFFIGPKSDHCHFLSLSQSPC